MAAADTVLALAASHAGDPSLVAALLCTSKVVKAAVLRDCKPCVSVQLAGPASVLERQARWVRDHGSLVRHLGVDTSGFGDSECAIMQRLLSTPGVPRLTEVSCPFSEAHLPHDVHTSSPTEIRCSLEVYTSQDIDPVVLRATGSAASSPSTTTSTLPLARITSTSCSGSMLLSAASAGVHDPWAAAGAAAAPAAASSAQHAHADVDEASAAPHLLWQQHTSCRACAPLQDLHLALPYMSLELGAPIAALTQLTSLTLSIQLDDEPDDSHLPAVLQPLRRLRQLALHYKNDPVPGLGALADGLTALRLRGQGLSPAALADVAGLSQLQALCLEAPLSAAGVAAAVRDLPALRCLTLHDTGDAPRRLVQGGELAAALRSPRLQQLRRVVLLVPAGGDGDGGCTEAYARFAQRLAPPGSGWVVLARPAAGFEWDPSC